ncbi:DUF2267 domain-containing protein [Planobispora siamensis]|uniref:DUF2267 domain-containing protein n=1 Tax=Planobispora siamensis TaxID=936338 RepID=A0A8J3WP33_9ACTN|nr:DUF2267 domain-containing protein [Planobispora siamensis]GIH94501.1 hypothetical protein Psi01_51310 [Planobispora siamensis]
MKEHEFLSIVSDETGLTRDEAETLVFATLETLAERLTPEESDDLAAQLPEAFREPLLTGGSPEDFGVEEFVRRVARRSEGDVVDVREDVHVVFSALRLAAMPGELDDTLAQLPGEYAQLL